MKKFLEKITSICNSNEKVEMFIDMDGTITEYEVYQEKQVVEKMGQKYESLEPITPVIKALEEINNIPNINLYILSLAKSSKIQEEKQKWLKKYVGFIKKENWILLNKENGEYSSENRDIVKPLTIREKMSDYSHGILLDDDHKILKETAKLLKDKVDVFHISSALI